jgi:hypothetical protein
MLVLNDDVALVHPDPELDPLVHRHFSIALVPALSQIPKTLFRGPIECDPGVLTAPNSAKFDALSYALAAATFNQSEAASKRRTTTHSIASYCPPF